jgi:myo-inositol 2-dehydrogenase/D-chiro-inositol 1-dehydrogenase
MSDGIDDPTSPPAPIRLGIAGLGAVAQTVYLPLLSRRPAWFDVTSICDVSETVLNAVGDRLNLPESCRHHELGSLAADGIDAVLLLTSGSHGAHARAILDAGLFVLCEKPLAYTLAEADVLVGDPRLQLGYMKVFDPAVDQARRLVGTLGELRAAEVTVLHPSLESQVSHLGPLIRPAPGEALPAGNEELLELAIGPAAGPLGPLYADVLLGSVVHDLAVLDALTAGLRSIERAQAWPVDTFPPSVALEGPVAASGRAEIRWHYLPERPTYREEVRLHFTAGSVELTFPSPYWMDSPTQLSVTERAGESERMTTWRSPQEAFDRQLLAFAELVSSGGKPEVGAAVGRAHIVLCQQAVALIAEGRGVGVGGEAAEPVDPSRHA